MEKDHLLIDLSSGPTAEQQVELCYRLMHLLLCRWPLAPARSNYQGAKP